MMPAWVDALVAGFLVVGACATLVGAWGLLRLPDFMMRLHAPTKAVTLGVGCALMASSLVFGLQQDLAGWRALLPIGFLFVTAPVSAHMLARAWRARGNLQDREAQPASREKGRCLDISAVRADQG